MTILLWLSVIMLFYTFIGYPLLVLFLSGICGKQITKNNLTELPLVSVVLIARNEEPRILARIENLLASDYPKDKLEIIVISDGSEDATATLLDTLKHPFVRFINQPVHIGKSACLNLGIQQAAGKLVIFADARQRFDPATIRELVGNFTDPIVGAVSGLLKIDPSATSVGNGIGAYWRLEVTLRSAEANRDSCIGCTGAVYAIRRDLFAPIPNDTILDDVVIPMLIAMEGYRVAYDREAIAYDPQALDPVRETIRKQRTLIGNYQMLIRYPRWLLPWHNRLWWQLISHKYLRLLAPVFLMLAFVANLSLIASPYYATLLVGQCCFYLCALVGICNPSNRTRLFSLPGGFLFLNVMVLRSLGTFLFNSHPSWPKPAGNRSHQD